MEDNKKNNNQNNFNGPINFNGPTQVAGRDIINHNSGNDYQEAQYKPKPLWRSPFTMAVLTWISLAIGILGVFPISNIVKVAMNLFNGSSQVTSDIKIPIYLILLAILMFLFILFFSLRRITKNQTRHPLLFNYAISGYGRRLTLEKIHIEKCPQCGGKMKYYNKPVEWIDKHYSDGKSKREVTKRIPVLECKRNNGHCYPVDPAEDKVK